MKKRMLSLLLAVCMLVSLLPVGMLSASADDADAVVYDYQLEAFFLNACAALGKTDTVQCAHGTQPVAYNTYDSVAVYAPNSAPWKFLSNGNYFYSNGTSELYINGERREDGVCSKKTTAITLKVAESGTYSAEFIYDTWESSQAYSMFLAPHGTAAATVLTDDYFLWSFENADEDAQDLSVTKNGLVLAAGEYDLYFRQDGTAKGDGYLLPDNFILTKTGEVPVESIEISSAPNYLENGETVTLSATVLPAAAPKNVRWSSSSDALATVDANGVVKAIGEGVVTITATATDGSGVSGSVSIRVLNPTLSYRFHDSMQGVTDNPNYLKDGNASYAKSESVGDGWAHFSRGTGNSYLYYNAGYDLVFLSGGAAGDGAGNTSCRTYGIKIKVDEPGVYSSTFIYGSYGTSSGAMDIYLAPSTANSQTLAMVDAYKVMTTLDIDDASWPQGHVAESTKNITLNAGENYVWFIQHDNQYVAFDSLHLTKVSEIPVESITVSGAPADVMKIGATATLSATILPEAANYQTVTWSSSDNKVATVSAAGVVTAVSDGTAVITAKVGNKEANVTIVVQTVYDYKIKEIIRTIKAEGPADSAGKRDHQLSNADVLNYANAEYVGSAPVKFGGRIALALPDKTYYTCMNYNFANNVLYMNIHTTAESPYYFTINVAEAGEYSASVIFDSYSGNLGAPINIYLTPASVKTWADANNDDYLFVQIPEVNTSNFTYGHVAESEGTMNLPAGEYNLWYVKPATDTARYVGLDSFKLTREGDIQASAVNLTEAPDQVLAVGETCTLSATVEPATASQNVTWTSSDDSIATVSGGVVTARGNGVATITATAGNKSASTKVYVGTPTLTYDFLGTIAKIGAGVKYDNYACTYDAAIAAGSAPWAVNRSVIAGDRLFAYSEANGTYMTGSLGVGLEYKSLLQIKVTEGGEYRVVSKYKHPFNNCAPMSIYITPMSVTTLEEARSAKYLATTVNRSVGSANPVSETAGEQTFLLGEGEYRVWIVQVNENSVDRNASIQQLQLHKVGDVVSTANGAAIRTREPHGQRFTFYLDNKYQQGDNKVVGWGSVLVPTAALVNGATVEDMKIGATLNGYAVADVPADVQYKVTPETTTFTAVLVGIPATKPYYRRSITARAYAVLEDGTVIYSDSFVSRSIFEVAYKICKAPQPNEGDAAKRMAQAIYDIAYDAELDAELDAEYGNN